MQKTTIYKKLCWGAMGHQRIPNFHNMIPVKLAMGIIELELLRMIK